MESLTHLAIVWTAIYAAFILARKTRLTPVLWYLAMGAILVNVGLLPVQSDSFIRGLGEIGIVMIMFALGFEEQADNFLASIKKNWGIAFFGAVAPFFTAYAVADYFFQDTNIALMSGLTMTATAVSLTMVSLRELGLHRKPAATRIITSAVLDDIAALAMVAILVPVASGEAELNAVSILLTIFKAIAFFVLVTIADAWLLPVRKSGTLNSIPIFGKLGTKLVFDWDKFVSVIPETLVMTLGLFVAQILSAALAARYTSGMDWANSVMVGLGMLDRPELAFVVMDIAYVQNSILSTEAFYTLMFTAFWLNVSVPVMIGLWKSYCGIEAERE